MDHHHAPRKVPACAANALARTAVTHVWATQLALGASSDRSTNVNQ